MVAVDMGSESQGVNEWELAEALMVAVLEEVDIHIRSEGIRTEVGLGIVVDSRT